MKLVVLKFGSSVLTTPRDAERAVAEIYRFVRQGRRVLAVVSAIGPTTDRLLDQAAQVLDDQAPPELIARLLGTGETAAAALLTMALLRAGIPAQASDAAELGLTTVGPPLDASLVDLDREAVGRLLAERPVLVVPGFLAQDRLGRPTLLGRGGSDLTALFLAAALEAEECRLLKDVDGIYEWDPAEEREGPGPRRYAHLSCARARRLGGGVVQPKSLDFAAERERSFTVGACGAAHHTRLLPGEPTAEQGRFHEAAEARGAPLRVLLLGLGTVGLGAYRLLSERSGFEVVGCLVRDAERARAGVPPELISADPAELSCREAEVVIELLGGLEPAGALVEQALRQGRHVVTANKDLLADRGAELSALAESGGVRLLASASVGGVLPALERVAAARAAGHELTSLAGVLNGTTNYVLDRLAQGQSLAAAVADAQREGLAEADPSADLLGLDAGRKLILLARAAWGEGLSLAEIERQAVNQGVVERAQQANRCGQRLRAVASVSRRGPGELVAGVRLVALPPGHPLADVAGAENRLVISGPPGSLPELVDGRGAGRWPTAQAVLADLLDLARLERPALSELSEVTR